jgi:hypothetical protein
MAVTAAIDARGEPATLGEAPKGGAAKSAKGKGGAEKSAKAKGGQGNANTAQSQKSAEKGSATQRDDDDGGGGKKYSCPEGQLFDKRSKGCL